MLNRNLFILSLFSVTSCFLGELLANPAMIDKVIGQPRYEVCVGLACIRQLSNLSSDTDAGGMVKDDFFSLKAKFAPSKSIRELLDARTLKKNFLIDDEQKSRAGEKVAKSFLELKNFIEDRNVDHKVLYAKQIRGAQKVENFLQQVSNGAARFSDYRANLLALESKNYEMDSEAEKLRRSQTLLFNRIKYSAVAVFPLVTTAAVIAMSFNYELTGLVIAWLGANISTSALLGTHLGYVAYRNQTNSFRLFNQFYKKVDAQLKSGELSSKFIFLSVQAEASKQLVSHVQKNGEGSTAMPSLLDAQADADKFMMPISLMHIAKPETAPLQTRLLFHKDSQGTPVLTIAVTAQKKPRTPSSPAPKQEKGENIFNAELGLLGSL